MLSATRDQTDTTDRALAENVRVRTELMFLLMVEVARRLAHMDRGVRRVRLMMFNKPYNEYVLTVKK